MTQLACESCSICGEPWNGPWTSCDVAGAAAGDELSYWERRNECRFVQVLREAFPATTIVTETPRMTRNGAAQVLTRVERDRLARSRHPRY